jgi:membrane-associated phospholipid phosphatase
MDLLCLYWLNGWVGRWPDLDRLAAALGGDHFLRSVLPLYLFGRCWFERGDDGRRARMAVGLAAVCLATALCVAMQTTLLVHVRPALDPVLGTIPSSAWDYRQSMPWPHPNSFPSDTATLYFALATVIYIERPRSGWIAMVWTLLVVCLPRVYFGYHYPSDILAGCALGASVVGLCATSRGLRSAASRVVGRRGPAQPVMDAVVLVFFADLVNLFGGARHLATTLLSLAHSG